LLGAHAYYFGVVWGEWNKVGHSMIIQLQVLLENQWQQLQVLLESQWQQLQVLLDRFGLLHQVNTFVKDEGTNLYAMAAALHSINDCEPLKILRVYEGTCFGHVMSKAC